jgi:hypothetical protein
LDEKYGIDPTCQNYYPIRAADDSRKRDVVELLKPYSEGWEAWVVDLQVEILNE